MRHPGWVVEGVTEGDDAAAAQGLGQFADEIHLAGSYAGLLLFEFAAPGEAGSIASGIAEIRG